MLDGRLDCSTQNLRLPVASISSFITFESIKNDDLSKGRIFIIGGGIVGCALAFYLSEPSANPSQPEIVVLDKSLTSLMSSTRSGAPGFVGQLNASKVLTKLAMSKYQKIPGAFDGVGGMEIASTPPGAEMLRERLKYAQEAGLPAELICAGKAAELISTGFCQARIRHGGPLLQYPLELPIQHVYRIFFPTRGPETRGPFRRSKCGCSWN